MIYKTLGIFILTISVQSCNLFDQSHQTNSDVSVDSQVNKQSSSSSIISSINVLASSKILSSSSSNELNSSSSGNDYCNFLPECKSNAFDDLISLHTQGMLTDDGGGTWRIETDKTDSIYSGGTTQIYDENGRPEYFPACNVLEVDCKPIQNGYLYGRIEIQDYAQGTTGWGKYAGAGLIYEPTLLQQKEPGPNSKILPIGIISSSTITIDMDVSIVGGSLKSGNNAIKIRFGEANYNCVLDGTCMHKKLSPQLGRVKYTFKASDLKKNMWIYTDKDMISKGRNIDNYNDVYKIEVRHDAEPQASMNDTCTPSTAIFKIYSVEIH